MTSYEFPHNSLPTGESGAHRARRFAKPPARLPHVFLGAQTESARGVPPARCPVREYGDVELISSTPVRLCVRVRAKLRALRMDVAKRRRERPWFDSMMGGIMTVWVYLGDGGRPGADALHEACTCSNAPTPCAVHDVGDARAVVTYATGTGARRTGGLRAQLTDCVAQIRHLTPTDPGAAALGFNVAHAAALRVTSNDSEHGAGFEFECTLYR
jgi:hypothetical protein